MMFIFKQEQWVNLSSERRVTPEVEPGYLRVLLPKNAPETSELWDDIMKDVERTVMPGITHWQHPRFHAYFPAGNSYPSILGEMLSAGLGVVGFSWAASPACTELETIVLDWIGKCHQRGCHRLVHVLTMFCYLGRMMCIPAAFLPFDPNRDSKESDDDEDDDDNESFIGSDDETIENNNERDATSNNDTSIDYRIHVHETCSLIKMISFSLGLSK
jgi:Pyridoxal-dependent decarboxylase conserved domain